MGIHNDQALLSLTEDLRQPDLRQHFAAQHVGEGESGTYRGQLIGVTHQNEPLPLRNGFQETVQQLHIHHTHLVHDHRISPQWQILIPAENHLTGGRIDSRLQQAVNGRGFLPCYFGQPFCRPAGGRRQGAAQLHMSQQGNDSLNNGGFAGTGAAGDQQHTAGGRGPDSLGLLGRVTDIAFRLNNPHQTVQICRLREMAVRCLQKPEGAV